MPKGFLVEVLRMRDLRRMDLAAEGGEKKSAQEHKA